MEITSVNKIIKALEDRKDDFYLQIKYFTNSIKKCFDVRKYAAATRGNRAG